jgi:polygalacturonase
MTHHVQWNRRDFLKTVSIGATGAMLLPLLEGCAPLARLGGARRDPWEELPAILARIVPPTFPARDYDVTQFGAVGDGTTDCGDAFREAIASCNMNGGGRVVVPPGRYLTGPIHLRSKVNLHVMEGATILFSTDPARYLPAVHTRWEGVELMGYSPLIYAFEQDDIAITGKGTLDGQASTANWWPWKGGTQNGWKAGQPNQNAARQKLFAAAEQGVPVPQRTFAEGSYLRPQFIQPYRCRNVLIEGVTILRSPMWEVHPVLCTNVTVRNVSINSHGPNNDGCDPESCRDVLIEGCTFDTGDDCIAIKSGRNADGRRLATPSQYIVVRECRMKDGHGGVTVGSEISGGVHHVYAEKCVMDSPNLDRALRLKNNAARGGVLEHIYMRDVQVGEVADAVLQVDFYYEEGKNGAFMPVVRDLEMLRVTSRKSQYGIYARAFEGSTIADVRLLDCRFDGVAKGNVVEGVQGLEVEDVLVNGRRVSASDMAVKAPGGAA